MLRLWLYMKTATWPFWRVKPSAGGPAHTFGLVVGEPLQVGGSPVAATPKASVVSIADPEQVAVALLAMQAGGMPPPLAESAKTDASALPPVQSIGSRQTSTAPAPVPIVKRPPLVESNVTDRSLGDKTPVRKVSA